jgi:hypothetical protein
MQNPSTDTCAVVVHDQVVDAISRSPICTSSSSRARRPSASGSASALITGAARTAQGEHREPVRGEAATQGVAYTMRTPLCVSSQRGSSFS